MQVKFIALAIAAMAATPAFAQGSVEIYGSLDALFSTKTNDGGLGITLDNTDQKKSRLGFKGEEKLGHGLTAFFQLEQRFYLNNGQNDKPAGANMAYSDKAWIGLKGAFGSFNFGRVNTALDSVYGGSKIGNYDTIADMHSRRAKADTKLNNGINYKSPKLGPVTLYATTALKQAAVSSSSTSTTNNAANTLAMQAPTPYAISGNLTLGGAFLEAAYSKDSTPESTAGANATVSEISNNMYKNYGFNGGYKWSKASLYAGYFHSKAYNEAGLTNTSSAQKQAAWAVGFDWTITANGKLSGHVGQVKEQDINNNNLPTQNDYGLLYQYSLSKRTQVLSALSLLQKDGAFGYPTSKKDSSFGIQIGLRHGF